MFTTLALTVILTLPNGTHRGKYIELDQQFPTLDACQNALDRVVDLNNPHLQVRGWCRVQT